MGRKPRVQTAGGLFHVWARRVDRWPLFVDDGDYRQYISYLAATVRESEWTLLSFCLMPNHVHLLVRLGKPNLAAGMQKFHRAYVRWFNDRHDRSGRLFEHRYGAKLVMDELYYLTVLKYIEANPVEASLCERPEEWPWCSRGFLAKGFGKGWLTQT